MVQSRVIKGEVIKKQIVTILSGNSKEEQEGHLFHLRGSGTELWKGKSHHVRGLK